MYKVIKYFTDLQDGGYPYHAGEIFPREGLTVTAERLAELSGGENRQKTPLIQLEEKINAVRKTKSRKVPED